MQTYALPPGQLPQPLQCGLIQQVVLLKGIKLLERNVRCGERKRILNNGKERES